MKFLHTADWHIGRRLHGYDLSEEQADALRKLEETAIDEKVDAIVIAGDIYDRGMPSEDSVRMVNGMIKKLNLADGFPLLAISGNHDSAERLATGSEWFEETSFYLHTRICQAIEPIEMSGVQFFLMPYFEIGEARRFLEDETLKSADQCVRRIVSLMKERFKKGYKHVLVGHFFAVGSLKTDSETQSEVGGLDAVGTDELDCFDYVALGHLHQHHASRSEKVKYSGSLLKYSVSETSDQKGVYIVDTDSETIDYKPLEPLNDVRVVKGRFENLIRPENYRQIPNDDYVAVELEDRVPIIDVMNRLKKCYPRIIELKRANGRVNREKGGVKNFEKLSEMDLFKMFYKDAVGDDPDKEQCKMMERALQAVKNGGKIQ